MSKETLSFLDDDIAKFMEEAAAAAREAEAAGRRARRRLYEQALRVIGHWIDEQKPKDVFLFEQDGRLRRPAHVGGQAGVHHELAEFTRDDVDGLVAQAPDAARQARRPRRLSARRVARPVTRRRIGGTIRLTAS